MSKSKKKLSSKRMIIQREKKREVILGSLLIFSLILIAIAGGWYLFQPQNQVESPIEEGPESTGVDQEHPGTLAPDFSLTDLDGNVFRLSDFKGKVVVIDFMATWCGPCRVEMPHYGTIWEEYGDNIGLMSIDIDPFRETEQTLRKFAQEFPYATWIWAMDTANLGQDYQVTSIPKTVIIDQDGYIRFEHIGVTPASTFIIEIEQLLF